MLTIGSLFSGIGGLELGLEWAGLGPVLWQVEREPFCRAVLAKHWPDAERFDDVRTVGAHNLARVDLICGGFPCQDISFAGKGAGLAGERSGLWFEFARIVGELRPRFVVVENVSALLSRGMGDVLGTLASRGYDATWATIRAADVGAPHLRDRVFLVGHAHGESKSTRAIDGEASGVQGVVADAERHELASVLEHVGSRALGEAPCAEGGRRHLPPIPTESGSAAGNGGEWFATEPDVGRVADGVPARVDRLRALGNAVVPQCAEVIGWVVRELAGLDMTARTPAPPVAPLPCLSCRISPDIAITETARASGVPASEDEHDQR